MKDPWGWVARVEDLLLSRSRWVPKGVLGVRRGSSCSQTSNMGFRGERLTSLVRLLITVAIAASFGSRVSATERWHGGVPKNVYTGGSGWIVLTFPNEPVDCQAVGTPKYMYIVVGANGVTADGAKQMLATAMLAVATGKSLSVAYDDATASCYINRVMIVN